MVMRFKKIVKIIGEAGQNKETVNIFYPETEKKREGWREVEPYSLTTDIPPGAEYLVYGKDQIKPGHIFNAYTIGSGDKDCHSFILGKIKKAKRTGHNFEDRKKWKIRF